MKIIKAALTSILTLIPNNGFAEQAIHMLDPHANRTTSTGQPEFVASVIRMDEICGGILGGKPANDNEIAFCAEFDDMLLIDRVCFNADDIKATLSVCQKQQAEQLTMELTYTFQGLGFKPKKQSNDIIYYELDGEVFGLKQFPA